MTDHIAQDRKLVRAEFEAYWKMHLGLSKDPAKFDDGSYKNPPADIAFRAWQAATQRQQERIAELDAWNEKLASYLANCRDAFPVPAVGSDLESDWTGAMADPDHVSEYVRAQVQALSLDAGRWKTFISLPYAIRAEWACNLSLVPVLTQWIDQAAINAAVESRREQS